MSLRQTQSLFVRLLGDLIQYATSKGYELTLGDGLRADGKGHMKNSLHYEGLAQDLNLFVNGEWKDDDCPEWQDMGQHWKDMNDLCAWGGDFVKKDYNHFSLKWQGRE